MIQIQVKRDGEGIVYGFLVKNHGDSLVCSAVSALVINTVNSITELTAADITIDADEVNGGYLDFQLIDYADQSDALLLLKSLYLGLKSLEFEHKKDMKIKE